MPPRPSLHSLLLMAASASSSNGGNSGLLLAARRRLPAAAAATAVAWGHRIRLLHPFSSGRVRRRPKVACSMRSAPDALPSVPAPLRSRDVHLTNNNTAASEERLEQLIQKLKNEGIDPKEWKPGNFQRLLCPKCNGGSKPKGDLSLSVYIRSDGMNATWNCFRTTCGWRGFIHADGFTSISQGKNDLKSDKVSKSTFFLMEALEPKVVAPIMQKLDVVAGQVDDLSKKVDAMAEKLDAVIGQVDDLSKVDAMAEKLDAVAGQVDDLSKKVDTKVEKLDAVAVQADDLISKVDAIAEKLNILTADK